MKYPFRKPKVTYRQEHGDDGYCYQVRMLKLCVVLLLLKQAIVQKAQLRKACALGH
jgi:hypothetical protein